MRPNADGGTGADWMLDPMATSFYAWPNLYREVFTIYQHVGLCMDIVRQFDFHVPDCDARYGA